MTDHLNLPDVSVVVPVFNREKEIVRAVESLINQDFEGSAEIVVVDDGSTDSTVKTLERFGTKVRVVRQNKQGAAVARGAGVVASRAPLVVFMDSDDFAPSNKLSVLVAGLRQHPECLFAYGITMNQFGQPMINIPIMPDVPLGEVCVIKQPYEALLATSAPLVQGMNIIARRECALKASENRAFYRAGNDYDFQIRLAQQGQGLFIAQITCRYELRTAGISREFGLPRQIAFALHAADSCVSTETNHTKSRPEFQRRVTQDWFFGWLAAVLARDWELAKAVAPIGPRRIPFWKLPWAVVIGILQYVRYHAARKAPESWRNALHRLPGLKRTSLTREIIADSPSVSHHSK